MRRFRRLAKILLISGIVVLVLLYISNRYAMYKIEDFIITSLQDDFELSMDEVDVNLIRGNFVLSGISIHDRSPRNGDSVHSTIGKIQIKGLNLYWLWRSRKLIMRELSIENPQFFVDETEGEENVEAVRVTASELIKTIRLKHFKIKNGSIQYLDSRGDTLLATKDAQVHIRDIVFNTNTKKRYVPLEYSIDEISLNRTSLKLGRFHTFSLRSASMNEKEIVLNGIRFVNRYSKSAYQQYIPIRKSWFHYDATSTKITGYKLGTLNGRTLLSANKVHVQNPYCVVYDNDTPPESTEEQDFYSKVIRDLPFHMNVKEMAIGNGALIYEEHLREDLPIGYITLSELNGTVKHVHNLPRDTTSTVVAAKLKFMGAPSEALWHFQVNDTTDHFVFDASIRDLDMAALNTYLEPNMRIKTKGDLHAMAFRFDGDADKATGEMKVDYEDMKVEVLKESDGSKHKILTALANIVVKDDKDTTDKKTKTYEVEHVPRHTFFKFIFECVKAGFI